MNALDALNIARQNNVSPAALHVILTILTDPPMLPTTVAKMAGISTAAVTGMVASLERRGMVERGAFIVDRRTRPLIPTEKAFDLFQPAIPQETP